MRKAFMPLAVAAATLVAGTAMAAPANAATSGTHVAGGCPTRDASPMLTRFGDTNDYFEVANGSFASRTDGWSGSYGVSAENEPWKVNPASSVNSLTLSQGQWATTPAMCVGAGEDTFRFFYKGTGMPASQLTVRATIRSNTGTYTYTTRLDASRSGWQLSPTLSIPNYSSGADQTVSLQFSNTSSYYGTTSRIYIDDVLIDPWRSRGF